MLLFVFCSHLSSFLSVLLFAAKVLCVCILFSLLFLFFRVRLCLSVRVCVFLCLSAFVGGRSRLPISVSVWCCSSPFGRAAFLSIVWVVLVHRKTAPRGAGVKAPLRSSTTKKERRSKNSTTQRRGRKEASPRGKEGRQHHPKGRRGTTTTTELNFS